MSFAKRGSLPITLSGQLTWSTISGQDFETLGKLLVQWNGNAVADVPIKLQGIVYGYTLRL